MPASPSYKLQAPCPKQVLNYPGQDPETTTEPSSVGEERDTHNRDIQGARQEADLADGLLSLGPSTRPLVDLLYSASDRWSRARKKQTPLACKKEIIGRSRTDIPRGKI